MVAVLAPRKLWLTCALLCGIFLFAPLLPAIAQEINTPAIPNPNSSVAELEERGDMLRAEKRFLDSVDFYKMAISKQPSALLWNKLGIDYLFLQRYKEAKDAFDHAIRADRTAAEGYNNRGFLEFKWKQNYGKALKYYRKALQLRPNDAVFHYNVAAVYFARHDFTRAAEEYRNAYMLDHDIFERVSRTGVMAQASSPEDRAAFSFMVARMYAQAGDVDRSLEYLRKAMEEGYKDIKKVYTDSEFASLREDKRFSELMAQKPQPIQ